MIIEIGGKRGVGAIWHKSKSVIKFTHTLNCCVVSVYADCIRFVLMFDGITRVYECITTIGGVSCSCSRPLLPTEKHLDIAPPWRLEHRTSRSPQSSLLDRLQRYDHIAALAQKRFC